MDVRFVASVSPVVRDAAAAQRFYRESLGLTLEGGDGDYAFTERLDGVKHFGLWPLAAAAEACFGTSTWPADVPVPQASVEFEVDDVGAAAQELQERGHRLLHGERTEPWGQVTARLLTADGLLVAVCRTPWLRAEDGSEVREAFWQAVDGADAVLRLPGLAARWHDPSALPEMTVGEVAAHLVRAVTTVVTYLSGPVPTGRPVSAPAYYDAVLPDPTDTAATQNAGVRDRARADAEGGPQELLGRWSDACSEARRHLSEEPLSRLVRVAGDLVLTVGDYLPTRVVELVVHTDDLAVSLGVDPPEPSPAAAEQALRVLLDVARRRHGDRAVLLAMTRRERASADHLRVL